MLHRLIVLFSLLSLGGCASLLDLSVTREGYSLHSDIAYGEDARQSMNIYVPSDLKAAAPVVIFFHGGSWKNGSKDDYRFLGQALASQGFVTVVAEYRVYPDVHYPEFVIDGGSALRWVHEHIGEYNGDARNIFVAGHSAGAFNAMMLTANDELLKAAGAKREWIRGVIGVSGPYDFLPLGDDIKPVFSKVTPRESQPITYITKKLPPVFLATGDDDTTVRPANSFHVAEKLKALGSPVEQHVYPGVGHITIILSLARGFRSRAPLLEDIARFVRAHSISVPE